MFINKIALIFLFIPAFLFLQGCQDNIILPDTDNLLQAPRLLYPPNNETEVAPSLIFSWSICRGARSYSLQVSTDSLFNTIVYDTSGITNTSHKVNGLLFFTKYYWRINAVNRYEISNWSTPFTFFTATDYCDGITIVNYFGKIYSVIQIGHQCWLKENLDVGTMIQGSDTAKDNSIIEKYCYDNSYENCNKYGGLYEWDEAMQYTIDEGAQGICPPGWHIPTHAELQTLKNTVGDDGNALKALGQGNGGGTGTNTSGFSALLAGYCGSGGGFYYLNIYAYFWSSTEGFLRYALSMYLENYDSYVDVHYFQMGNGFSVRCLKD